MASGTSYVTGSEWRLAVYTYRAENPGARAIEIAQALGCTEAEALAALSNPVFDLDATALPKVLAEIRSWELVLVLVRNVSAVAELTVPADNFYVKKNWLNWIDDDYNLHINIGATKHILGLVRPGKQGLTHSFNLINRQGHVFCRFYTRTGSATVRFLEFCQTQSKQN